jgi:hypothetical protein
MHARLRSAFKGPEQNSHGCEKAGCIKSILPSYTKGNVLASVKEFSRAGVGIWPGVRMLEALENHKVICASSEKALN